MVLRDVSWIGRHVEWRPDYQTYQIIDFYGAHVCEIGPVEDVVLDKAKAGIMWDKDGVLRYGNPFLRLELGAAISLFEVQEAMHALAAGKSLGPDGLPSQFYKAYVTHLAPRLLTLYEEDLPVAHLR
ncbi:hypothetical protein NDU88_005403 [Pleurodeles waltl]|uniref:Uncharacterized protein n=1 Tax=Pleurodeles waltl TaxID=8319 RepID=A0AAV7UI13_PLEWA|nr:hypothetical protein NDU88_005403 [Pleurodeles waltl]